MTDFEHRFSPSLRPLFLGLREAGIEDRELDAGCSSILYSNFSSPPGASFSNRFGVIESCELFQAVTHPPAGRSLEAAYRRWSGDFFPWTIRQTGSLRSFDTALSQWRGRHPSPAATDLLRFLYEWPFDPQGLGMNYRVNTPERSADQAIASQEGDCTEFTMICLALLSRAGFSPYPVWVSEDNRGDRFLHLAAAVDVGGTTYFFDPAYDPQKNPALTPTPNYDPLLPGHRRFSRIHLAELLAWYWSDVGSNRGERARTLADPDRRRSAFESAVGALDRAAAINPMNPWIFANRGVVNFYRGLPGAAAADFQEALSLDGANPQALAGLGDLNFQQGRYPEAARYYARALQADPVSPNYREFLIRSLYYAGRREEARRELGLFPASHPHFPLLRDLLHPPSP